MGENVAKKAIERTSKSLIAKIFENEGKVAREAAASLFSAVVQTGSTLVSDIASTLDCGSTSKKGLQEKVSGWLNRYDFATPIGEHLWTEGVGLVTRDTVIAIDSGDISKEFGGNGMEGMEMGYDASRGVTAMGHSLLCAAIVLRKRATALRMDLLKGRRGLPKAELALFDALVGAIGENGIPVHDRGFDGEEFLSHAIRSKHRAVVRMKTMTRDLFGTGGKIEEDMARAPCVCATLRSPTKSAKARVRWRRGYLQSGDEHLPVLIVSSTFNGTTLYLYAINFEDGTSTLHDQQQAAILAANAYFCRWSIEVLFQDVKQCFSIEGARVRTFKRLENLLAVCMLAYEYFAHVLPGCGEEIHRLLKTMRESLGAIVESFRPFVANVRTLLSLEKTRFISGRPRKLKPPDTAMYLPGLFPCA